MAAARACVYGCLQFSRNQSNNQSINCFATQQSCASWELIGQLVVVRAPTATPLPPAPRQLTKITSPPPAPSYHPIQSNQLMNYLIIRIITQKGFATRSGGQSKVKIHMKCIAIGYLGYRNPSRRMVHGNELEECTSCIATHVRSMLFD